MESEAAFEAVGMPEPLDCQALAVKYYKRMYSITYNITGRKSDAEDAIQQIFLRLAEKDLMEGDIRDPERYLYRAASWAAKHIVRQRTRTWKMQPMEKLSDAVPSTEARNLAAGNLTLQEAMQTLDSEILGIVILFYEERMTQEEIGKVVGKSRAAVAKILERARGQLRQVIDSGDVR